MGMPVTVTCYRGGTIFPPLHIPVVPCLSHPVHLFISAAKTHLPILGRGTGNMYEFSPPRPGWWRLKAPQTLLQSAGTITRVLDWHLSLTSHYLQSGWMDHVAKARYKRVVSQTAVTAWTVGQTAAFLELSGKRESPCGESMSSLSPTVLEWRAKGLGSLARLPSHLSASRVVTTVLQGVAEREGSWFVSDGFSSYSHFSWDLSLAKHTGHIVKLFIVVFFWEC